MLHRARAVLCLFLVVAAGCARGGEGADGGGGGLDADVPDSATPDGGDVDATVLDAGDGGSQPDDAGGADAGPSDAGTDGGGDGPVACTSATAATVCGTRPCVDGYCCDQPCDGACRGCAVAGAEGRCTLHAVDTDPEDECASEAASTCGTTGVCDGSGACAMHDATVSCDDATACTTGDLCDGAGVCRGEAPADCAPASGNECCLGSCDASGGCLTTAGSCADICGGSTLTLGRTCMGCGAARAAGSCLGGSVQVCDSSSECQQRVCGGTTYFCTGAGGTFAWRASSACDDGDPCTFGDVCGAGTCGGSPILCLSTTCLSRTCNGTASCTEAPNTGAPCDDGNLCTYGDACTSAGACSPAGTATCTGTACLDRTCNGTATCTDTPRTGLICNDGNLCTVGETCSGAGVCTGGSPVTCPPAETCRTYACNGSASCTPTPRNVGGACDDGNAGTPVDRCQADGTCLGLTCSPSLVSVFSETFASPSSTSWSSGTDANINASRWNTYTTTQHGARITSGRLEITNVRSGSPNHGQGFAYVRAGGAGSHYDNSSFSSTLGSNAGQDVVWSFNMRRDDPESTDGGFDCSSTGSQNDRTVGLAYVLGATSATGMTASTGTCSPSATANGYAVIFGGNGGRLRLVRFQNGLRNGTLTTIVQSNAFSRTNYLSVRVTFNADTNVWRLEARSDGSSSFSDPATGSFSSTGTGSDATYVGTPLDFAGPYFQSGCCCLCGSTYTTRFDNVSVGVRCAGG